MTGPNILRPRDAKRLADLLESSEIRDLIADLQKTRWTGRPGYQHEWALLPLRVRRIERVRLHADLTILAKLAVALTGRRGAVAEQAA